MLLLLSVISQSEAQILIVFIFFVLSQLLLEKDFFTKS